MNRILQFLPKCCPECSDKARLQNRLDEIKLAVAEIEADAGPEIFEFYVPSAETLLKPRDDFEPARGVRIFVSVEARAADLDGDMRQYAIDELRGIAMELTAAADRLEGGVSP
jgi:hypothetical protein